MEVKRGDARVIEPLTVSIMERMPLEWFFEVPIVTRVWTCSILAASILEQCNLVSQMQLVYNYRKVVEQHEYWRLMTTFIYFGPLNLNLIFYIFFVSRYSRMLESSFYRNKTAEYAWILVLVCSSLLLVASFLGNLPLLGPYLSSSIIYVWARRNPDVQLSFLGLFVFSAPYLPWVLSFLSVVVQKNTQIKGQLLGIIVGHFVFFFEDIYPTISNGKRPLTPPWLWFQRVEN
jgi:Derlin-2/3